MLGLTAAEFRHELPLSKALDHYAARLILPYEAIFERFNPLGAVSIGLSYPAETIQRPRLNSVA